MNNTNKRASSRSPTGKAVFKILSGAAVAGLGVIGLTIGLTAQAAGIDDDRFVFWPSQGFFRAYPPDAEDRRFAVFGSTDVGVDDNVFRISQQPGQPFVSNRDLGDTYAKLAVGALGKVDFSLQELNFDATIGHYAFDEFSELDNTVYDANANFLWRIADRAHGDVGYSRTQRLPNFSDQRLAPEDLILSEAVRASIALRLLSRVEARAEAEEVSYEHDAASRSLLDNTVRTGKLGLFYITRSELEVGVEYKVADGEYPNRQAVGAILVNNEYRETEYNFVMTKMVEPNRGFDLRIGRTERVHEDVPARDFEGTTGRATFMYSMRPKITLNLDAYRELRAIEELAASYALVTGGSAGPSWAPTLKTVLEATFVYEERDFAGDPGFALVKLPPREDRTRSVRIAAGYQPNKHLLVGLSFESGKRDANVRFVDFEYNLVLLHVVASM